MLNNHKMPEQNPIQDLLDQANNDLQVELICEAFTRGVKLGSENVLKAYREKILTDLTKIDNGRPSSSK